MPNRSAKAPFCLRTAKISINFLTCKNYFRMSAIMSRASRQSLVITDQSLAATASFGKRLLPIPTQVTPALNHPSRFSRVGFTPPVTIILLHGIGARRPSPQPLKSQCRSCRNAAITPTMARAGSTTKMKLKMKTHLQQQTSPTEYSQLHKILLPTEQSDNLRTIVSNRGAVISASLFYCPSSKTSLAPVAGWSNEREQA